MRRPTATIRKKAAELLLSCGIDKAPVQVETIATHLGIDIRQGRFDGDISGFLYRVGPQSIIGLNEVHAPSRRRFTLAHELGHFILHSRDVTFVDHRIMKRDRLSAEGSDPREIEANAFAAELLMPAHFLEHDVARLDRGQSTEDLTSELATLYKVSETAMMIRLVRLGYVDESRLD